MEAFKSNIETQVKTSAVKKGSVCLFAGRNLFRMNKNAYKF